MTKVSNKNLEELTSTFLSHGLTAQEQEVMQRLLKNPDNREYFRKMYILWYAGNKTISDEDVERALQKVLLRINTPYKSRRGKRIVLRSFTFGRVAAAAVLLFIAGATIYLALNRGGAGANVLNVNEPVAVVQVNKVTVPLGSKSTVELPDGTIVILNAGSTLQYAASFGESSREVELEGEGYFKVVRNEKLTFTVRVKDVVIKALGTEFNVTGYPEEETVRTTLVSGSVSILHEENNVDTKELILKPKQTATIFTNTADAAIEVENETQFSAENMPVTDNIVKSDVVLEEGAKQTLLYTSWKDARWIIEAEPLEELVVKLQRRYNVRIFIMDEALKNYPFNGIFTDETLEQLLEIMKMAAPIKYTINKNDILLSLDAQKYKIYKKSM